MLGPKTSLNKFKKTGIVSTILSDHNAMKLEISQKKKTEKHRETWNPNSMLLNNGWVNNEIKEEIKGYLEMKMRTQQSKILWDTGEKILRGKFIALQAYYLKKQEKLK